MTKASIINCEYAPRAASKFVVNRIQNVNFSDITVKLNGREVKAHRLVIGTRTKYWENLAKTDVIDLTGWQ